MNKLISGLAIGENIREYRNKLGISQDRLSQMAEVGSHVIAQIEAGTVPKPGTKTVQKIADALGVTFGDLTALAARYVALLRGVNAGKERRVEMKRLKSLFESLGYTNVSTYINSGNVLFAGKGSQQDIRRNIELNLKGEFGFDIPTLVKTEFEIAKIAAALPRKWRNDSTQRSDVAYLFPEIDQEETMEELPIRREFVDIRYVDGALYWNIDRNNYHKSHLNKLIGHKLYQQMTVRNINTARYLAGQAE